MPFSQDMCLDFALVWSSSSWNRLADDELTWKFLKGHLWDIEGQSHADTL